MPAEHRVEVDGRSTTARVYAAEGDPLGVTLVLAHGAGAPQTHPFMVRVATELARRGVDVVTFNFLYLEEGRKLPDRTPVLEACFRAVVGQIAACGIPAGNRLFLGGKSLGGRMASHLAAAGDPLAAGLSGLVLFGYPLHPPGKPESLRVAHLPSIRVPVFIAQGERDPFGSPLELAPHFGQVPGPVTVHAVPQGGHSLETPRRGGTPMDEVFADVCGHAIRWMTASTAAARLARQAQTPIS